MARIGFVTEWVIIMSEFICRYCSITLTEETARIRKEVKSGFRNECKKCRNEKERSRTRKKQCEYCGIWCVTKGIRSFCSMICRFKSYYTINLVTQCWNWRKKWCDKEGYGNFIIKKKKYRAHRIAYKLFKGEEPPKNLFVCHACDNPSCVNPDHLWLGTNQDNQLDRIKKIGGNSF